MKTTRLLFLVPALFLQLACGSNNPANNTGQQGIMANGVCYLNGQPTSQSACAYSTGATTQSCNGNYYQCSNGIQAGISGCTPGSCVTNSYTPDTCKGYPNLYTTTNGQTLTPVTCI